MRKTQQDYIIPKVGIKDKLLVSSNVRVFELFPVKFVATLMGMCEEKLAENKRILQTTFEG